MGSRGGSAPNAYRQRSRSTLFLRVPVGDWTKVKVGEKTEFRTMPGAGSSMMAVNPPTPVVAYTVNRSGQYDAQLMVLLARRVEPLWEISGNPEALAAEGFESYDVFRRYWRARQKGVYRPLQLVTVWRVRRAWPSDRADFGVKLFDDLYGEFT
jgi:hypothetical protein